MERSRSKRSYYYDQDYDSQNLSRTKPRYHHHHGHHYSNNHRRRGNSGGRLSKQQEAPATVTTSYRILCPDIKAGGVIGKSGSIIKAFRQETGAWINVHPLIPGDEERIIEISDIRRRDPDGRVSLYSPAQEALLMIHERILESDVGIEYGFNTGGDDDEDYVRGGGFGARAVTRLVVQKLHVGCLLGKGGKIIEQMRIETKTHIRILPRDQHIPRCVSMADEIVQIVGHHDAVKKATEIISSRLKESQGRDRGPFRGRIHSPEHYFPPHDDFSPHTRSAMDVPGPGSSSSMDLNGRINSFISRASGYGFEAAATPMAEHAQSFSGEEIVFRMLCPNDKVDCVMGEAEGIIELLRGEIGVDVSVTDPVPGSDERVFIVSSEEGPDDELFPAQEALLHIQNRIVDLGPDKDNIITTRLLVPASEIGCLEGKDGALAEMRRLTHASIQILSTEELPQCALGGDEVVQIEGDIRAARDALVHVTSKLRSYLYREISFPNDLLPLPVSGLGHIGSVYEGEADSPNKNPGCESYQGNDLPTAGYQNIQTANNTRQLKQTTTGSGLPEEEEGDIRDEGSSGLNRPQVPFVTKRTLKVVIPERAVPSLLKSGNKLAQISEMSGATLTVVEDQPDAPEKWIQISGSPEQADRAQSLLQGFILSVQDAPAS